ncbi:GMC oxidoreductase [Vararia minispora EC-137]|uniref:GMC oxidoreductase n=1 Tax=Vararia minispora EC-137 TaxID=1314806 RepID=A0ACB8QKN8_9AGAM|nr:GMC oxidoreductase [Vararia minispora EC-137]
MESKLASVNEVSGKSFDYVIVGGGTAGLVLANRLSENPNRSVLVLEAGGAHFDDPSIYLPASYGKTMGNAEYDWGFSTVPQKHSDGVSYYWARGKGLGGSSAVNFYNWGRPCKGDIDAWEALGNPGWNWKNLLKYSMKSERFIPPPEDAMRNEGLTYDMSVHGTDGPLVVGFPNTRPGWDIDFTAALAKHGIEKLLDPQAGSHDGIGIDVGTVDPRTNKRTHASQAYLEPVLDRPNLTVLVNAPVIKIVSFINSGELVASGVEFAVDGKTYTTKASTEVILSAGAIKSPQLLELSGIGDTNVLGKLGIETKVDLPAVGTNVQDHLFCGVSFELTDEAAAKFNTVDPLLDPVEAQKHLELHKEGKGLFTVGLCGVAMNPLSKVTGRVKEIVALAPKTGSAPGLNEQYTIQHEWLAKEAPLLEVVSLPAFYSFPNPPTPGKKHMTLCATFNRPFSRGTIHAASTDALTHPEMDPHYLEEKFDEEAFVEQVKFIRRIAKTEPLAAHIAREVNPGPDINDTDLAPWVRKTMTTVHHVCGSTSMLPRDKGGVVDAQLKVYGTRNLRVIDLGIVPLHFSAHPQAAVYAIAEQDPEAADIIKGTFKA